MKAIVAVFVTLLLALTGAAQGAEIEVAAKKVKDAEAPQIDGKVDKVWDTVRATKVTASEGPQGKVEWPDKTMSLSRLFKFDGKEGKKGKGNEDYFALAWDINNTVKDFPKKGCTVLCHKQDKELLLRTNAPGERMDYWFHKPQRMGPVGQADDQYLTHELKKGENSARRTDPKTAGGYEEVGTRRPSAPSTPSGKGSSRGRSS